jgi:hypothetical protein
MIQMDKKTLDILRKALRTDGIKKIQERFQGQVTTNYIYKVLNGTRNDDEILEAAIEVAREEKEKKDALKAKILELAK